jgi:hypothetical protein
MCQGDYDNDDDCEGELVCRQHNGYEVVPGCERLGIQGTDYCGPKRTPGAMRVVAFGDVHGDVAAAREALMLADVLDANDNWIGGTTNVVQLGDHMDRGTMERQLLDLFEKLIVDAKAAGSAFYPLIGNHEVMNTKRWFGDVSEEGWAEFEDVPYDANDPIVMSYPPEKRGRVKAFKPGGMYAKLGRFLVRPWRRASFPHRIWHPKSQYRNQQMASWCFLLHQAGYILSGRRVASAVGSKLLRRTGCRRLCDVGRSSPKHWNGSHGGGAHYPMG